jgi:hypothetical protein
LIQDLSTVFKQDPFFKNFATSYLYLNADSDELTFFNAGLGHLIHIPEGETPRILHNHHALLEEETLSNFSETTDNWKRGDILLYHSLVLEDHPVQEKEWTELIEQHALLSAQPQAETLLKHKKTYALFPCLKESQVIFSIQRIS